MSETSRQVLMRYLVAIAAVVVTTLVKLFIIGPLVQNEQWFLLYVAAICLGSWYGGFGPGVVTVGLSTLFSAMFFAGSVVLNAASVLELLVFLVEGMVVVALTGNLRDRRTQAVKSEQSKDEALALLDSFQVYAPMGLAFLDTDLRYIRINYAMAELDGLTPAAHIGKTMQEVQPELTNTMIDSIRQVLNTGKPLLDQELTVSRPTMLGVNKRSFLTSYYRIRGGDGQTLGVGIVMLDISDRKQAEDTLRESEARFRTMADSAPVMIWMADPNLAGSYYNKPWLDFTGRTIEQELGDGWEASVHPDDLEPFRTLYSEAFAARQEYMKEYRLRRYDGEYRWILDHGVPRFSPNGAYVGYVGSSIDITERKRLEDGQAFVLQAGVVLASSLDYETRLTEITRLAVPTMADWCAVDLLSDDGQRLERVAVAHIDPEKAKWAYELALRYPVDLTSDASAAKVIRTGKTDFIPEITEAMIEGAATSGELYEIMQQLALTAEITVPLNARGRTIGVLTLVSAESKRHYTEIDVQLAEQLANRAALAVDNARLFSQANAERERFRVTLSSIGDAVIATDHDGNVTFLNAVASKLTGWSQAAALGRRLSTIFKIVNEQTRATVENPVDKVLREGKVVGMANHTVLLPQGGGEIPIDDSGAPIPAEDGSIGGVVLVFRDVSERKREEQRQQFLVEASSVLGSSLDYETTLNNVVRLAVPTMADWCAVDLLAGDGKIERIAVAHIDPDKVKWAYEIQERFPPDLNAANGIGHVLSSGETEFVEDIPALIAPVYDLLSDAMKEVMDKLQATSVITTPLKARGSTIGALTFATAESGRRYQPFDVQTAETLAVRAALAVDNARLFSQAQAERERLKVTLSSIGDAVIATDNQGQVTFMNSVATTLTGWTEADALGKPLADIFKIVNEQTRATVESPVDKVLREGRVFGLANHTVLIHKSGFETPIDDSGAPIPAEDGSISGVVLVFRDVSERKRAERRQQILAEAGQVLISSLEYEATLQHVSQLAVPGLADWCMIYLTDDNGEVKQAAMYHLDPEGIARREAMLKKYPPSANDSYGYLKVINTGKSELLPELGDSIYNFTGANEEHREMLRGLNYKSSLSVPLRNVNNVFGALTLTTTTTGGRTLNSDDLALAEELARIVGLAIENARLYRKAQGNTPGGASGSTPGTKSSAPNQYSN